MGEKRDQDGEGKVYLSNFTMGLHLFESGTDQYRYSSCSFYCCGDLFKKA